MVAMKKYSLLIFLFISVIAFGTRPLPKKFPISPEIIMHDNHVLYVTAVKGDSYYKIAKRHNITLRQLHKYNEQFPNKDMLEEGSIIYLGPRRNHSRTHKFVILDQSMTLRELAQKEAVKLKPMMRKNQISSPDEQLPIGDKIILR